MRSMPLYRQLSASAIGYCDLMGMKDDESHYDPNYHHQTHQIHQNQNATNEPPIVRPILCRSRSEKSAMFDSSSVANSSMVAFPQKMGKPGSMLSESELGGSSRVDSKRGKASSVINGAELQEKSKPKGKKKKASSLVSGSIFSKDSRTDETKENKPANQKNAAARGSAPVPVPVIGKSISRPIGYEEGQKVGVFGNGKYQLRAPPKPNSILSGSEVGPSPSEVAAMMERRYPLEDDRSSSVLDGWSLEESVEGLRSKLERWRTELPPLYDTGFSTSTFRTNSGRKGGHADGGDIGLFSCFGNICGYECQCVCGKPPSAKSRGSRLSSPSIGSTRRSF